MNHAHTLRIDSIHRQHKQVDTRSTAPQKERPTPAGRLFRKQWGRGSELKADKWSRKHPYILALPAMLYFLMSK